MKKVFAMLLILAMLACSVPVLADETAAAAYCYHSWTLGDVVREASCTSTGIRLKVCVWCDAVAQDFITLPKTGHDYSVVASYTLPASCTDNGWGSYACADCGEIEAGTRLIPAFGHSYSELGWTEATCIADARYGQVCARCGDEKLLYIKPDSALGHDVRETVITEASCTSKGLVQTKCSRCDLIPVSNRELPMLAHSYKTYNRPASCTQSGLIGTICEVCGGEQGEVIKTPAAGHQLTIRLPKEPSCTETGLTIGEYCAVCSEVTQPQTIIPALGHQLTILLPKEPSCTEAGLTIGEYCATCKEVSQPQETIPALGHKAVTVPGKAASCDAEGLTAGSSCSVCKAVLSAQQPIPMTEHMWELNKTGKKYVCENCGEEASAKPTDITINTKSNVELEVGDTLELDVIYSPKGSYSPISWTSSNKKVVSIDADGAIEALKEGSATITAKTANSKKDTIKIKVIDPSKPTKVELDQDGTIILGVGEELQLNAALYPETAVSVLEWDCSSSRCKVDEDGLVTAVRTGSATITVETENGKTDSVKVRVVKADEPYSVTLSESETIFLAVGEELQLEAEILPATVDAELKWSSSSSRCEVDEDGCITGVRAGSATITVKTSNGKKDTVKIKVY